MKLLALLCAAIVLFGGFVPSMPLQAVQALAPSPSGFEREQQWIADEIGKDIVQILAYAKDKKSAPAVQFGSKEINSTLGAFEFTVQSAPFAAPVSYSFALQDYIWSPANYSPWSYKLTEGLALKASKGSGDTDNLPRLLYDLTPQNLIKENAAVSAKLAADPLDPVLHEQAAMICAAFAMHEDAGFFDDVRHALNRITAHLAIAKSLRGDTAHGVSGQVAEATLLTLTNRQSDAIKHIEAMEADAALKCPKSWTNALRMRITNDYRILAEPKTGTRLEQLEYARALANSISGSKAIEFAEQLSESPDQDWVRLAINTNNMSVGDGHQYMAQSLSGEFTELWTNYTAINPGTTLGQEPLDKVLNHLPSGCVRAGKSDTPTLAALDWSDWAQFHQRHICNGVLRGVYFFRFMLGSPDDAEEYIKKCENDYGKLMLYPLAQCAIMKVWKPTDKPLTDACTLCWTRPQLINATGWVRLWQMAGAQGLVGVPGDWLNPNFPPGTAFDFHARFKNFDQSTVDLATLDYLRKFAPYDKDLTAAWITKKFGRKPTLAQVEDSYKLIKDFNLQVMSLLTEMSRGEPAVYVERATALAKIDPLMYFELGDFLVQQKKTAEAVTAYETGIRTCKNPVAISNNVDWLVNYYYDHNRKDEAVALALVAGEIYSARGLLTLAHLLERMNKLKDAEQVYISEAERYSSKGELLSFYERHKKTHKEFEANFDGIIKTIFPSGMQHCEVSSFTKPPVDGVILQSASLVTHRLGLKPGDIVVAIDGTAIHNHDQYQVLRSMKTDPNISYIVWNGKTYTEVKATLPQRRLECSVETYPGGD